MKRWMFLLALLILAACNEKDTPPLPTPITEVVWLNSTQPITSENASQLQLGGIIGGHQGTIFNSAYSPNGWFYLTIGGDQRLLVTDIATGRTMLRAEDTDFKQAFFLPDEDTILSLDGTNHLRKWSLSNNQEIGSSVTMPQLFTAAALSPDGSQLAVGADNGTVALYEVSTLQTVGQFIAYNGGFSVLSLAYSPDSSLLYTVGEEGSVISWNTASQEQVQEIEKAFPPPLATAVSPDGQLLAVARSGQVNIYELMTGQLRVNMITPNWQEVRSIGFSADSAWLAVGGEQDTVDVYEVSSGQLIVSLPGHGNDLKGVAFAPDQQLMITGVANGDVYLWNLSARQGSEVPRATLNYVRGLKLYDLDWSPDGSNIILLDESGRAFMLNIK